MMQSLSFDSGQPVAQTHPTPVDAPATRKSGPKPGSEAAKRGGRTTRDRYGAEHFRQIGATGGSAIFQTRGVDYYQEIGRRGGETTRRKFGSEHYARIGRIGGRQRGANTCPKLPDKTT